MSTTGSHKGFTIVELIVVVVIVAVVATMAAPRLFGTTGQMALRASGERLLATAKLARDTAAAGGRAVVLRIRASEGVYGLETATPEGRTAPLEGAGRAERLAEGTWFAGAMVRPAGRAGSPGEGRGEEDETAIAFGPDGGADAAVVRITNGRGVLSLVVSPACARVGLTDRAVDDWPKDRWDLDEQGR